MLLPATTTTLPNPKGGAAGALSRVLSSGGGSSTTTTTLAPKTTTTPSTTPSAGGALSSIINHNQGTNTGTNVEGFNTATSTAIVPGSGKLFNQPKDVNAVQAAALFGGSSPSVLAQIQYQMYQAGGLYTASEVPTFGVIGAADISAFKKVIETTVDSGTPINVYLPQIAQSGHVSGIAAYHTPFAPASSSYTLANPTTLAADVQNAATLALGHGLTSKQVNDFITQFQSTESGAAQSALAERNAAAQTKYEAQYGMANPTTGAAFSAGNPLNEQSSGSNSMPGTTAPGSSANPWSNYKGGVAPFGQSNPVGPTILPSSAPIGLGAFMQAIKDNESSGGNYTDGVHGSNSVSGAYQMSKSMWGNFGGYANASDAPPNVQDAKAAQQMTAYYHEFGGNWALVAAAWNGGPGVAQAAQKNPSTLNQVFDGSNSVASYVQRAMSNYGKYTNDPGAVSLANSHVYDPISNPIYTQSLQQGQAIGHLSAPNATDAANAYAQSANPTQAYATQMANVFSQVESIMHGSQTGGAAGTVAPAMP